MLETGTRNRANQLHNAVPSGTQTRSMAGDPGMSKRAGASMTFGSGQVSAANGTFAAFGLNDVVVAEGTNLNNGYFTVTGVDGANQAFLTLSPAPAAEGPVTATLRTA